MDKHRKFFVVAFVFAALGIFLVVQSGRTQKPDIPAYVQSVFPTPLPSAPQMVDVVSPDGKKTLTMKQEKKDDATIYTFSIFTLADNSKKIVFTKTLPIETVIAIHHNTFSPDNKYVLLEERTGENITYFVLPLFSSSDSQDMVSPPKITDLFYAKYPDFKITDVTGWGGVGLVVVNTDEATGGIGPSFWFDVSNASFIKLSTRFN